MEEELPMAQPETKKTYNKKIVIPIEHHMWQALRKISYEKEISMSQLTRWAIEKIINKYGKTIDEE
jgi:hypothetical protein